jgi:hypothetical protein
MGSKKARDLLFLLYSSAKDLGKQEKPDQFVIFTRYFRFQNVIFKKVHVIKKKSPCLGDSKHIFELKIAQVVPKKNGFKKARDLPFYFHFVL